MGTSRDLGILLVLLGIFGCHTLPLPDASLDFVDLDHEIALAEIDRQFDSPVKYENEYGSNYDSSGFVKKGQKGDNGYTDVERFEKAILGQREADGHSTRYKDEGARKAGHVDNSKYYKDQNSVVKSSAGGEYAVSNSFNKGSKTTGFHNVHHKEEYKKNKKFYDEKDQNGYYRRYGDFGAASSANTGNSANGHRYDSGYRNSDYGKQGFTDHGSLYDNLKGYGTANGHNGYYDNYENFRKSGNGDHGNRYRYYN